MDDFVNKTSVKNIKLLFIQFQSGNDLDHGRHCQKRKLAKSSLNLCFQCSPSRKPKCLKIITVN
jgi:hypothetical protein